MKKILSTFLLVLLCWTTAWADNIIKVSSIQGHPGDEVTVSVSLDGDEMPTAVEMQFALNDALKYVDASTVLNAARSNGHNITAAVKNGSLSIVVFSPTLAVLKGSEGELFSFKLKLGKEPADYTLTPVVLLSDSNGNSQAATVQNGVVTLLSPKLEMVTPSVDFGHIPIRATYTKSVSVRNVGNEPLEISAVTTDRSDLVAPQQQYTIAPGSTQQVVLTYSPTVRGAITSKVNFATNAINPKAGVVNVVADPFSVNELHVQRAEGVAEEEVTVALKMNNMEPIAGAQCTFILPSQLEYVEGSAAVGSRCEGTGHIASGFVQGQNLTLLLYSGNNTTLPEGDGELMTFKVRLKGYLGNYTLAPKDVVLSNVAMENMVSATTSNYVTIKSPQLSANANLRFPEAFVMQETSVKYALRNSGNQELKVERVTFLSEGFSVAEELPITISTNATKELTVKVYPQKEGAFSTVMQVYTNDPLNPMQTVKVDGYAYEANHLSVGGRNTEKGYQFTFGLDNYSNVVALQMNLKWLPNMTTSMNMLKPTERLKNHSVLMTDLGNGIYQVLVYSLNNAPIPGNTGDLFTIDYDFNPMGEVVQPTVKRVNSTEYITNLTQLSNDTKYFVYQSYRGPTSWAVAEGGDRLKSNNDLGLSPDKEDPRQQFAFITKDKGATYYLYHVAEGKYVNKDGRLSETMNDPIYFKNGNWENTFFMYFDTQHYINVGGGQQMSIDSWSTPDGGNSCYIIPAGYIDSEDPLDPNNEYRDTHLQIENIVLSNSNGDNKAHIANQSVKATFTHFWLRHVVDGDTISTKLVEANQPIQYPEVQGRTGYTLVWDDQPTTMPGKYLTVQGTWKANKYTITFDTDGGTKLDSLVQDYATEIVVPTAPTKTGYTFAGWDKEIPATMPAEDVTIKALWKINQYTIIFDTDGGTAVDSLRQDYATEIVAPADPTKTGYAFVGWDKEVPVTMPAEDVTIKALWKINQYTITFDTDCGTEVAAITQDYATEVTAPAAPTKIGYTFIGWDKEVPATMPAEDVILTAQWQINQYTVTFMDGDRVVASATLDYNSKIEVPESPEKEGHTFEGWTPEVDEFVPAYDVTYYAEYTVNEYKLTYYINDVEVYSTYVRYGEEIEEYVPVVEEGYEFKGWETEIPGTMPAHDVEIYGVVEAITQIGQLLDNPNVTKRVYTLDGKFVTILKDKKQYKQLRPGLYIINGVKVLKK